MGTADENRYLLTNASMVAGDRILEGGTVAAIAPRGYAAGMGTLAPGGRLLLPDLVDLRNDALEKESAPRPGTNFDSGFARRHFSRKLAARAIRGGGAPARRDLRLIDQPD